MIIITHGKFREYRRCQSIGWFNMLDYNSWKPYTSLTQDEWFDIIDRYDYYTKLYSSSTKKKSEKVKSIPEIKKDEPMKSSDVIPQIMNPGFKFKDGRKVYEVVSRFDEYGQKFWVTKTLDTNGVWSYSNIFTFDDEEKLFKHV